LENSEIYECEHDNRKIRRIQSEYTIEVCNKCYDEFTNLKTKPLFLAKQILSLTNKMIEKTPEFMNEQESYKSLKLWHNCNIDVLKQLKKLNLSTENKNEKINTVEDETNYNFNEILHETEVNEQDLDGKNLHDLYRHSTKLIK
jgi:hypothetical protein|tara:strand:- start:2 stop:433 length:432 start_codon:yes stop_codon:yes gene_type:complete